MNAMTASFESILPLFRDGRRFVLTTHVNPDGDALGSELALGAWLTARGKQARIINCSPTPPVYRFLDPGGVICRYNPERDAASLRDADTIVVLDANHPGRLREMESALRLSGAVIVCIDHHLEPAPFARYYDIDGDATSTAEILYRMLTALDNEPFSPSIAQALYCAIMTDTGSFRYPRVDADIHRIVARLIDWGADPVSIYSEVYERWSAGRIHLVGEMLAQLGTAGGGKIAHVSVTREMLLHTGTDEDDTDNFTTYPMSMDGVVVGILFVELPGGLKISFRSRGDIPINELAKEFGGNGHRNAAGARLEGCTLQEAREKVLSAALKYVGTFTEGTSS